MLEFYVSCKIIVITYYSQGKARVEIGPRKPVVLVMVTKLTLNVKHTWITVS